MTACSIFPSAIRSTIPPPRRQPTAATSATNQHNSAGTGRRLRQNSTPGISLSVSDASPTSPGIGHQLFDRIPHKTAPYYASIIATYIRSCRWEEALRTFVSMLRDDVRPDKFLLPKILKACSSLKGCGVGAAVHAYMLKSGLELDVVVFNSVVDMYANGGDLESAQMVFDRMPERDVVSWTALVSAYASSGFLDEAVNMFERMQLSGVRADLVSRNTLISGFARNGDVDVALRLLDEMREDGIEPGTNSWNGIISGCVQNGFFEDALEVFTEMCLCERPNAISIASILPACSGLEALNLGKELHSYAIRQGIKVNVFVGGSLIDMYIKCGAGDYAERIFSDLEDKNVTVWNEMIAAYANEDRIDDALNLIRAMLESGLKPDIVTYNTILAFYARKGQKDETFRLFAEMNQMDLKPNVVSMNAVLSGFSQSGLKIEALELLHTMLMPRKENVTDSKVPIDVLDTEIRPNEVTVSSALSICTELKSHQMGKDIHGYILRNSFDSNVVVLSALVDMYAKCEDMVSSAKAFHRISDKNTVSWNVLMAGYNYNGDPNAALKLFPEMLNQGYSPSSITLIILLLACGSMAALRHGRELHGYIIKKRYEMFPAALASNLIDMYAKCDSVAEARMVFDCVFQKDIVICNAMMCGYSLHKMTEDAISLFKLMEQLSITPDHITFTAILTACRQEGFLEEGWKFFNIMKEVYGITPTLEHFTCMVDIMTSAGLLEESLNFIRRMPFHPDACVWSTLLKACKVHSNAEIAEIAARALFELEPSNASNYILLSNIFSTAGILDSAMDLKMYVKDRGLKMVKACSWIHLGSTMHSFDAGDRSHPDMDKIIAKWNKLASQMVQSGYIPQEMNFCEEGEVDPFSCYHTEKLAICLGIISLDSHSPIRVSKNVRMCMDCHSSTKIISKIEGRNIFVRDGCFYHHFKDGSCSCRDRW